MFKGTKAKGRKRFLAILLVMAVIVSNFAFAAETGAEEYVPFDYEERVRLDRELGIYAEDLSHEELKTASLSKEDIPEAVSAEAIAEKGHVNRVRSQERAMNTVVFQNRDGTRVC